MMKFLRIGIDNGLSGAIVALDQHTKRIVAMTAMPTRKHQGQNEIDAVKVVKWLRQVIDMSSATITLEACPEHAKQKSTMRSMGISYGILVGAITSHFTWCHLHVVRSGNPKDSWQKIMLGKVPQGQTGQAALKLASSIWPNQTWSLSDRHSTPDSGLVDAALIAEFSRRQNL